MLVGRVVTAGPGGRGVVGARVRVAGTDQAVVTDATGAFTLPGVAPGPVELIAEAPAHAALRLTVPADGRGRPVVLALQRDGEAAVSVTVTAAPTRPDTASTARLSRADIEAAPRRNAAEILRQVPGLTLVQHGSEGKGQQFFLRGFDAIHGADLALTVEGIPLNEWSNVHAQGYLDLGVIIPELVQGVRVTKGPFTLDQGAFAMAGSADYRLGVAPDAVGWRAAYTVGSTQRHRGLVTYAPPGGGGQTFIGVEATHDDGFGVNRSLRRATVNGRVRLVDLGERGAIDLLGLAGYAAFGLPGTLRNDDVAAGRVDFYGAYDRQADGASARALVGLAAEWQRGAQALSLSAYGGYRRLRLLENFTGFLINREAGDRRDQRHGAWTYGADAALEAPLLGPLALRAGLGLRGDVFSQTERGVDQALDPLAFRRDLDGHQLIAHGRAGLRWSPGAGVRVDAGARIDVVRVQVTDGLADGAPGDGSLAVASPRITARWRISDPWRLFLAYGRGYRPPEARAFSGFDPGRTGIGEDVLSGGEPEVTVSDAVEVGARWAAAPGLAVTLSGFATFIEQESVFDHVSGVNLALNGTRRLGGEVVLQAAPTDWLRLSADATLVEARFVASGNRVPHAPWLTGGLRAAARLPSGLRAGLRILGVAPRPLPHGATGATLVRTDATLGYQWAWLRLDLAVENLLNRQLREGEYHYASRWRPTAPASDLPTLHTTAGPPLNGRLTVSVVF